MSNVQYTEQLQQVEQRADSVLDLLIAQCSDLEALLALARREEDAALTQNFDELLHIISARAALGQRLEVYHRQITELRRQLGSAADDDWHSGLAQQTTALIHEIQTADARTRPLLLAARSSLGAEQQRVERGQRGVNAYLREGHTAIACDRRV
jgi:flagellar biosynthesis/type III secretory pathway chaperone